MSVSIKRAYEPYADSDGMRILVDKLWPRGIKKENAHIDEWLKGVAPSTELRQWFNHEVEKWPEFKQRYLTELEGNESLAELKQLAKKNHVTLVFAAKDEAHNNAVVLAKILAAKH